MREVDRTILEHIVVRDNRIVLIKFNAVLAQDLAVRQIWVGSYASIGQGSSLVEKFHDVDIHGGKFGGLDIHVSE